MTRIFLFTLLASATLHASQPLTAGEIVRRSVQANERDWQAAPSFAHQERETEKKDDTITDRTYQVITMDGSPYRRLIAIDGQPLSEIRERQEMQKEKRELARRRSETPEARQARMQKFQKDRDRDHLLMTQMAVAFTFHLIGEQTIDGHAAYVLDADPKPDYKPVTHECKVLLGMRGKMWVDKEQFHWIKVEAEVIHSVTFGGFLARVDPGTSFMLENEPVGADVWQPKRFEMRVAAAVLFWQRNSVTTDTYRDYQQRALSRLEPRTAPAALQVELEAQKVEQVPQRDDRQQPVAVDHQQPRQPGAPHLR